MTGFEGPITMASASSIADMTAPLGRARSIPRSFTPSTGPAAPPTIMNSWKGTQSPWERTQVATGSSHMGSTRVSTPIAATTAACASVSGRPDRISSVRIRHIARSRSPSRNQAGRPAPARASTTAKLSPRMPYPRASIASASQ